MAFVKIDERRLAEIDSTVRLYRHQPTGARLLSIENKDENKVFGIGFRTPPARSDGVAHIMEHSVLCGSDKYPVKEPFVELLKGSLNTFLNALTFPDKTLYPVASTNLRDFRNLVDVYLDAVFHPLLSGDTFRQEGWHFEVDAETGALSRSGVVYNEMKGAYSDPEDMHNDLCRRSLFPDTAYGLDSGGDPRVIPTLGYGEFKAFHDRYYHPSNSFIYFYGDDDPEERLAILEPWLAPYSRVEIDSMPALQAKFDAPKNITLPCEGNDSSAWVATNWALAGHDDAELGLALGILSHILAQTPASPLRKALIDSGLGEDLAGFGYEDGLRTCALSVGLKGVRPEDAQKVEDLVISTLKDLAANGIDPDTVEASLNTVEFTLREKNTGRFPRGLAVMLEALNIWLYDGDPMEGIQFEKPLERIKAAVARGDRYFERLISEWLLDNPHRTTVVLRPDPEEEARRTSAEEAELATVRGSLSEAEIEDIRQTAIRLHKKQETPDSPEDLAKIPSLAIADLPEKAAVYPCEITELSGSTALFHDLPTSSICYLDIAFPLDDLGDSLLPYAGLMERLLLEMGTDTEDYVKISQEVGKYTGGIGASCFSGQKWKSDASALYFIIRSKAMAGQFPKLAGLLEKVLLRANLGNRERFRQIVMEEKAQLEASIVPAGNRYIGYRLKSRLTGADNAAERLNGLEQIFFLRDLAKRMDESWPAVLSELEAARKAIVNAAGAVFNFTMDAVSFAAIRPEAERFAAALPRRERKVSVDDWLKPATGKETMEMLSIPTQVNFVGKLFPLKAGGAGESGAIEGNGAFLAVKKYLNTTFLWEKLRVQGGAYGGSSYYDYSSGAYYFVTYRDPRLAESLAVYDRVADYLRGLEISGDELTHAIVGTIGDLDLYLLPDAKGYSSLIHYLTGYSWEERQEIRRQVLCAGKSDFVALGEALERSAPDASVSVLTSPANAESLAGSAGNSARILPLK